MPKEKVEVGDIISIPTSYTFRVCKVPAETPEEAEWTPVEKISEAEILSFIYQQQKPATGKLTAKAGRPKGKPKADAEQEVTEEDL